MIKLELNCHQSLCILESMAQSLIDHDVDINSSAAQAFMIIYNAHAKTTSVNSCSNNIWYCVDKYKGE